MCSLARLSRATFVTLLIVSLLSSALAQTARKQDSGGKLGAATLPAVVATPTYAWTPIAALMTRRYDTCAVVFNNKLYVIGGANILNEALSSVEVYDPATNTWSAGPALNMARFGHAAVVFNNKIYVIGGARIDFIGGTNVTTAFSSVEVYDPAVNATAWIAGPSLNTTRQFSAAAVLDNKIYLTGGYTSTGLSNSVEVYDPAVNANAWSAGPALNAQRYAHAAVTFNNKLYVISGDGLNGFPTNSVEIYDPAVNPNAWSAGPAVTGGREQPRAAVLNNKIYLMGGSLSSSGVTNTVEVYDPAVNANTWSAGPAMRALRYGFGTGVINDRLYAAAGFDGTTINTAEVLTPVAKPGDVLISEFRLRGPAGKVDEFVELYNNTAAPITVATTDGSAGWLVGASVGQTTSGGALFIIPAGTIIPAHGHFLGVNRINPSGYSLGAYATGDVIYGADVDDDAGIALFGTADLAGYALTQPLDAVGFASLGDPIYREGNGLLPALGIADNAEFSWVRKLTSGVPQDTNNNAADFVLVATDPAAITSAQAILGAPGPENLASPIQRNAALKAAFIDSGCTTTTPGPNATPVLGTCPRVRDITPGAPGSPNQNGTLSLRRAFKNNTGAAVTRLRFRIVDITTAPAPAGTADLRALTSTDVSATCVSTGSGCPSAGAMVTIRGTTLDTPPMQTLGGGYNSSLATGIITTATPLTNGATINVQFLLGVAQGGNYRFLVNVEALP